MLFTLLTSILLTSGHAQVFSNPLHIPDTLSGTIFNLTVDENKKLILPNDSTNTYGINADYLGPTLIMHQGDFVQLNVTNNLNDTTTMHWHGMHVAPEDDGGPHTPIYPGDTWSPDFTVLDEATTFWYHPHLHHKTAEQVYAGAAGMILIRDTNSVANQLPHTYGVDEFPIILQDKSFDATNQFIYTAMADTMMVNGTLAPYLDVPAQMVRFHLLNASNQRIYNLGLPPQLNAWIIGSDGGLLESPISASRFHLTPGERLEVVIDFGGQNGFAGRMVAFNSELADGHSGGPNGPGGGPGNPLDGVDFEVLEFRVQPQNSNPITSLPATMNTYDPPLEINTDRYRTKTFTVDTSGFPFYINGTVMDMSVINDTVLLDDIEVWTLINETDVAHPWHIHDIQFFILDINGNIPPPHMRGRKDVVLVSAFDTIRYITQFTDFANDTIPYMFHCHNLFHEDGGMMGQFIVTEGQVDIPEQKVTPFFKVYPNPVKDYLRIAISEARTNEIKSFEFRNVNGSLLRAPVVGRTDHYLEIDVSHHPPGIYLLRVTGTANDQHTFKVIKPE